MLPEQLGYVLLAAYMFRSPAFSGIAAEAAKQLTPDFVSVWEEHEALALLPEIITVLLTPARARKITNPTLLVGQLRCDWRNRKRGGPLIAGVEGWRRLWLAAEAPRTAEITRSRERFIPWGFHPFIPVTAVFNG